MNYVWLHRIVDYTYPELIAVQRASRLMHDLLLRDRTALEERMMRGGHDGELLGLQRLRAKLDEDVRVIDEAIRKQWAAIINRGQPP